MGLVGTVGGMAKLTESTVAHLEAGLRAVGRDLSKPCAVSDDGQPGLVLRREPSGRKVWTLRYRAAGKRSSLKLGVWPSLSVAEARKAAKVESAMVAKGVDPVAERRAQRDAARARRAQVKRKAAAVLGAYAEGPYKEWAEVHLRSHAHTLAALKRDFAVWWGRSMDAITTLDVERWRRDALKAGNQKSTVNRAWQRLRAVLGKAHEHGLIGPPLKIKRFTLDARGRVRYLTGDERAALLAALDAREDRRREERHRMIEWQRARPDHIKSAELLPEHGTFTDHLKPLVLLVLNTGLRRGEALGLTWRTIDFARGMVHVQAATSKSGQSRDVPMTAEARKVLEALRDQQAPDGKPDPAAHLFTLGGERMLSVGQKTWADLCAAAGIADFRFHDLRHDYASRLVMAGVDLYSVSKLLGHSDVAMSQRYAHLAPDYLQAAVRKLDAAQAA